MNKLNMMTRFMYRFIATGDCLIPDAEYDLSKWAAIACDQFTDDESYWQRVKDYVGDAPSTLNMMYPEVYLKADSKEQREEKIKSICETTDKYFKSVYEEETSKTTDGFIYVKRQTSTGVRKGIMMCIDLKHVGAGEAFVPSEEVFEDKMKVRMEIRKNSTMEMTHIIMFANDKNNVMFGHDNEFADENEKLYSVGLMEGGGKLEGYDLKGEKVYTVADAMEELLKQEGPTLMVADGNHALMAAKKYYDELEKEFGETLLRDHPLRYALVEVVNIHDDAIKLFPIHRLIKNIDKAGLETIASKTGGVLKEGEDGQINIKSSFFTGSLNIEGDYLKKLEDAVAGLDVEYIYVTEEVLSKANGTNAALIMPAIEKDTVFDYVSKNGVMPRKSFSIGEAKDKKYYLETRRIIMI